MPTSKTPPPSAPEPGQTQPTTEQATTEQPTTEAQPQSQESGAVTVRVAFPYSELNGEGFSTITTEGTQLNSEELKAAQKASEETGVPLTVEDGSQNG